MDNFETKIVKAAKDYVLKTLGNDTSGHDYYHSIRVYNNAMNIAKNYQVNEFVIALASLLHDLDDYKISPGTNRAEKFLDKFGLLDKNKVLDIIDNMSFTAYKNGKSVESLEGKIVQDADRLDALGAVGIARCFTFSGFKGLPIYLGDKDDNSGIAHFYQKLFVLPDLMNTNEGKNIAKDRLDYMKNYLDKFFDEWE